MNRTPARLSPREQVVGHVLFPASSWLYNRRGILATVRDALAAERLPAGDLEALQLRRLQALLRYAGRHIPFYRERFREAGFSPEGVRAVADLAALPPLTREEVIARHRDMVDERVAAGIDQANASPRGVGEPIPLARFRRNRLIRNTSSGSTGTPTVFYEDGARTAMSWALDLRHRRWFGVLPGAREARMLRGRRDLKAASRIPGMRELLWNQLMLPGTNLTDADYRLCVQELQRFQPRVLWGFTSAWVGLAEFLRRDGGLTGDWRPAMINTWAAPLYEHEERVLAEVFGCPVTNVYGSREIGHVAACCPEKRLHVHADQVLVEIDEPAGDPPVGELLCTTLSPNIMPFIRYRMGDLGRVGATPCPCGRTLPVLEDFLGRTGEVFHTRDGRMISPNFWCRTFMNPALGGKVHRFQVLYRRDGGITMQIVQGPGYDNTAEHTIRSHVESSLGPATPLTFQYPDDIPPTTSGKYLMVRREEA